MVSRDTHRLFAILSECRSAKAAMTVEDTNRVMRATSACFRASLLRVVSMSTVVSFQPALNVTARVLKARQPVNCLLITPRTSTARHIVALEWLKCAIWARRTLRVVRVRHARTRHVIARCAHRPALAVLGCRWRSDLYLVGGALGQRLALPIARARRSLRLVLRTLHAHLQIGAHTV